MFDAYQFLLDFNIPIGTGKYASNSWYNVSCPFCGDQRYHLGIHKSSGACTCFKCGQHRLYETIEALTGLPGKDVAKKYSHGTTFTQTSRTDYAVRPGELQIPGTSKFTEAHKQYLSGRGFDPDYIIKKYNLRVTGGIGKYAGRIIIPIFFGKRIVSFQGRTYTGSEPKYLTCHPDEELLLHKKIFFNLQNAPGPNVLLVEGVFDVMKLGDNTIAGFGTSLKTAQINYLASTYKKVFILFDPEPEAQKKATDIGAVLSSMGVSVEILTLDYGDPGDLSEDDAITIKAELHLL